MSNFETDEVQELAGGETIETFSPSNIEYLQSIESLQPYVWKRLSIEGRLEALKTLESRFAEIQGRPPIPVVMEKMDDCGYFDGEQLHISIDDVKDPAKRCEVIGTVAHEGRHAYQHYAIRHEGFHPNAKEVAYWTANEIAYFPPSEVCKKFGPEYYYAQPQELDAFSYENEVQEIFARNVKGDPFEAFDTQLEQARANAEKSLQHQSFVERAGDVATRVGDCLMNAIDAIRQSPALHNAVRAGMVALAHHRV